MSTKLFTGTGFTPDDSLINANDKVDEFIKKEIQLNKKIVEDDRSQDGSILQTSNYYYCTIKLKYHYEE